MAPLKELSGTARTRRVTAEQVARLAGVSRSAVSRAYTAGAYVAQDKRERIFRAAEQLGYRPNALAASLNGRASNLVAIVTGNLVNHYDGEVVGQLVEQLNAMGKWPVVIGGASDDIREAEVLDVLAYPLDAMIIRGGSVDEALARQCAKLNVPLILSGRVLDADNVDCVCCDNEAGAGLAVEALIRSGRFRIGYVGGPSALSSEQERKQGFIRTMRRHGLEPAAVVSADFSFEGGFKAAMEILDNPDRPDGLFCGNDAMALGVLCAARQALGLDIPKDLSIIGFDDIEMAGWPCFRLTTIRNPVAETVEYILDLLAGRLDEPACAGRTIRLDPQLVERDTH